MTKILFVDDDAIARRNIRTKIDWKSYNWELIYGKGCSGCIGFYETESAGYYSFRH